MCDYQSAPSHNLVLSRAVRGKLVVCGVDQAMHMYPSRSADFCESDFIACARARVYRHVTSRTNARFRLSLPFSPTFDGKAAGEKVSSAFFFLLCVATKAGGFYLYMVAVSLEGVLIFLLK